MMTLGEKIASAREAFDKAYAASNRNYDYALNEAYGNALVNIMNDVGTIRFWEVTPSMRLKASKIARFAITRK